MKFKKLTDPSRFRDEWRHIAKSERFINFDYYTVDECFAFVKEKKLFMVKIKRNSPHNFNELSDIGLWIYDNLECDFIYQLWYEEDCNNSWVIWFFTDENDALMFKLSQIK